MKSKLILYCILQFHSISLFAFETELIWSNVFNQLKIPTQTGWMQSGVMISQYQGAVSETQSLTDTLKIFGTAWISLNNLPSKDPNQIPENRIVFYSRLLEAGFTWEAMQGVLVFDLGKKIIHPSSGFFKTPLNVLERYSLPTADMSPQAVGQWEEGWVETGVTWFNNTFTLVNYFIPLMPWTSEAQQTLQFISTQQDSWQNLTRLSFRIYETDIQFLALLKAYNSFAFDAQYSATGGIGIDSVIGESLTLRTEVSFRNVQKRLVVKDTLTYQEENQNYVWQGLAGFTWVLNTKFNIMLEYGFNGRGFAGVDYQKLLDCTKTATPSAVVLSQYGTFNAAMHYGFIRLAGDLDQSLNFDCWAKVNLQDSSGLYGSSLNLVKDQWSFSLKGVQSWGSNNSEVNNTLFLWSITLESKVMF